MSNDEEEQCQYWVFSTGKNGERQEREVEGKGDQ